MREFLKKLIKARQTRAAELRELIKNSNSADEVRSLGDTLQTVLEELQDAQTQLDALDSEGSDNGEGRDADNGGNSNGDEERNGNPMHEFRSRGAFNTGGQQTGAQSDDPTDSLAYRTAFMNFVCRGTPIPAEVRADAQTTTTDASAAIPHTVLNEIVREMKTYGEIYSRVRKLNVQGGVEIPILSLIPTATWVGEGKSEAQKLQANTKVSFSYYGVECKIAQTLLVNVTTIDAFQQLFPQLAAEAIVKALEIAIVSGDGSGKPLGITKDTRVPSGNVITLTPTDITKWGEWKKKVFGKIPKSYRNGSWIMAQGTFDGYIDGMVDDAGQPIARVNYGITDGETYRFGGKEVLTTETDVLADYDSAGTGDVIAVFTNLENYGANSNMEMRVTKWEDQESNEIKNKAIMICDGKLIDPNGTIIIKKGAAS